MRSTNIDFVWLFISALVYSASASASAYYWKKTASWWLSHILSFFTTCYVISCMSAYRSLRTSSHPTRSKLWFWIGPLYKEQCCRLFQVAGFCNPQILHEHLTTWDSNEGLQNMQPFCRKKTVCFFTKWQIQLLIVFNDTNLRANLIIKIKYEMASVEPIFCVHGNQCFAPRLKTETVF